MSNSWQSDKVRRAAAPLASYEFDFGLGSAFSGTSRPAVGALNGQRQPAISKPSTAQPSPSSSQPSAWSYSSSSSGNANPGFQPKAQGGSRSGYGPPSNLSSIGIIDGLHPTSGNPKIFSDLLGGFLAPSSSLASSASKGNLSQASLSSSAAKGSPNPSQTTYSSSASQRNPNPSQTPFSSSSVPKGNPNQARSPSSSAYSASQRNPSQAPSSSSSAYSGPKGNPSPVSYSSSSSASKQNPNQTVSSSSPSVAFSMKEMADSIPPLSRNGHSVASKGATKGGAPGYGPTDSQSRAAGKDPYAAGLDLFADSTHGRKAPLPELSMEMEGLPPLPPGITAVTAKGKGMESYKQGQFADAIQWLSWAAHLLEKRGDHATLAEVLTCRVSCYKEIGEYKKAVADCTRVIDQDGSNTAVLLQRGLLYESTEKYKLGVADLREVVRREPRNRVASNTLARLVKFANA